MQISATPVQAPPQNARPAAPAPFAPLDFKEKARSPAEAPQAAARTYVRPGSQVDIKV